ncbi:MAG: 6-bladed beta-propeller [Terriglobales bacterium]|jgi:DNA-binding beta-propeller fold protein YncE
MVQYFLTAAPGRNRVRNIVVACAFLLALSPASLGRSKPKSQAPAMVPQLELEGGRKLLYERAFSSELEVKTKHGFWTRLLDMVVGEPDFHALEGPYGVVSDSKDRIIVTDPAAGGIHIFDFAQHNYKFISRKKEEDGLNTPQCVAVDASDNIYATDSESGKIFVFEPSGKFQRVIGSLKGGEGFFKRPTGIAVDSEAQRIYVTDTLRNKIFVLDMQGNVLQTIGQTGAGNGEFNFPTELRLHGDELIVVDAMNFRVQVLDRSGAFRYAIGRIGEGRGELFRAKGIGVDSEGHLYVVEGLSGLVQVFDRDGNLLYYFGQPGTGLGEFQLPTGLFIDRNDRVFVVDSYNRRVQVFHYFGLANPAEGVRQ